MKSIPETREDVTIEWLSKAFQKLQYEVVHVQWKGPVGAGLGMLSCLERLTISYRLPSDSPLAPSRTLNLVMKTLPVNQDVSNFMLIEGLAQREYQMYDKVFPAWEKFMDERKVSPGKRFRYPHCYYKAESGEALEYRMVLLMEDLDDEGFSMWSPGFTQGMGRRATRAALRQLALFHAVGIAYKEASLEKNETYPSKFPFLAGQPVNKQCVADFLKSGAENAIAHIVEVDGENAPEGLKDDLQQLGTLDQIERLPYALLPTQHDTITHHDLHANNLMFRENTEQSRRKEAVLLDFQCCSYSNPMKDVTFLLFLTCRPHYFLQKDRLDTLLNFYHKVINNALKEMGCAIGYSIWQIQEDFRQFSSITIIHMLMGSLSWCFGPNTNRNTRSRLRSAMYFTYRNVGSLRKCLVKPKSF